MSDYTNWTRIILLVGLLTLLAGVAGAAKAGSAAGAGVIHIPVVAGGPRPSSSLKVDVRPFAGGLKDVTSIKHAGDDRLFVTQRDGRIFVIGPDGTVSPEAFLDIRDLVERGFWEQGLLGLAFAPDYATSGVFYVTYSAKPDVGLNAPLVLARYKVDPAGDGPVDTATGEVLLSIPHPREFHYGGDLQFGPDGYLYMASGDGELVTGPQGDPNALRGWNLLGKILRLDVDPAHSAAYAIPPDNPFVGNDDWRDEIWLYGLRNPWRISFDQQTGDLYIADVGLTRHEEINRIPPGVSGRSLGWPCYQGPEPATTLDGCGDSDDHLFPLYSYPHTTGGCSVIGGYVYRGREMPAFAGRYLFADLCTGAVLALGPDPQGEVEAVEAGRFPGRGWTTFGEDARGELYLGEYQGSDTVFRLVAKQ